MTTKAQLGRAVQRILTTVADAAARQAGFVRRRRTLRGASFVQALVFGWLANPDATAEERAQAADARGVVISAYRIGRSTVAAASARRTAARSSRRPAAS